MQQLHQAHAGVHLVLGLGRLGQPAQDLPAAIGLRQKQAGVFADAFGALPREFLGHNCDRGKGRAQFVRRGGGQAAQRRQPLLAGQDRLGDVEGQLHPGGLPCRQPGVACREDDAGDDRRRRAQTVDQRKHEDLAFRPWQRQGPDRQHRRPEDGQGGQHRRLAPVERGGRQGHGGDQQDDEGVGRTAGEKQQASELNDVEAELEGRLDAGRLPPAAAEVGRRQIDRRTEGDQQDAKQVGRAQAEHQSGHSQDQRLTCDGDPPQGGDGLQTEAASGPRRVILALQGGFGGVTHDQ